ncbi:MAG: hypothetical protein R6W68_07235 [Ignavibacteriaceae bacterium]
MKTSIKLTLAVLSFGFLFLATSVSLYAQVEEKSNDELVKSMTDNLKQKILLTDDQATKVRAILSEYVSNKNATSADLTSAQQKLESLLDNKQKMKYNILKNEWWKNLKPVSKQ